MRQSSQIGKLWIKPTDGIYTTTETEGKIQNGFLDAYLMWGIIVTPTTISELMTPPANKDYVSNASRLEHGKRVIMRNPRISDREVTLTLQMVAPDETAFLKNYNSFCRLLAGGQMVIYTTYQTYKENNEEKNKVYYHMNYISCTQFQEFRMGIAKISLKLNEPDPTNREV